MPKKVRIRIKIFFIVLVAVIPTVVITLYSAYHFRRTYLEEKNIFISNLCDGFVNEQHLIIRNGEEMLLAISQTRSVQDEDYAHLNTYLIDLMSVYSDYAVLLAGDSSGTVIASSVKLTGYSLSDREYFIHALETGRFSLGGYIVSKSTGLPSLPLALPVRDRMGKRIVLVAVYDLANYYRGLSLSRLSGDLCLEIFDKDGIRLFSSLTDAHSTAGQRVSEDLYAWAKSDESPWANRIAVNGIEYLAAAGKIAENGNELYVTVRVPWVLVEQEANVPSERIVFAMAFALAIAFALSLWLARRLFVRRIENLTEHTKLLAEGKIGIRTDLNNAYDEITDLMESFNAMASSLEERSLANQQTLLEKEQLLLELKERIADNLQLLSSLVSLQVEHAAEENVRRALMTTHSRVMALALVYETLYRYSDFSLVDMREYGKGLCDFLITLYANVGSEITCAVSGEEVLLSMDKALPIALILNELVSNSILHAFPSGTSGSIRIVFERFSPQMVGLRIIDDGIGLPGDIHANDTLGFEMIEALVEQVHGLFMINADVVGTDIGIRFPER